MPIEVNSLRRRFFSGALWSVVGAMAARSFAMITAIIVARILSVENFGKLSILISTTTMFASLAGLGLGVTCTRYVSALRQSDPARTRRIINLSLITAILSGCIMAILSISAAPFIVTELLAIPDLVLELRIISLLLITDTILGVQTGILAGFEEFRKISRIGIIQSFISLPLTLVGVWQYGITGAVSATVLSCIIAMLLSYRTIKTLMGKHYSTIGEPGIFSELNLLWRLAFPVTLSGIVVTPVIWMGNTLLARSAGGYSQVGIFNAAHQWRMLLAFLPALFSNVLLSLISSKEHVSSKSLNAANMLAAWLLVSFPALLLIVFPEISALALGSKYDSAVYRHAVILLMLVVCTVAYKDGIARRLITKDLMWWGVFSNVVWGGMFAAMLWWQPINTAIGLATLYLVCYIISTILFVPFYLKKGLVARYMVTSKESISIWIILLVASSIALLDIGLIFRVPLYSLLTGLLAYSFFALWRKATAP